MKKTLLFTFLLISLTSAGGNKHLSEVLIGLTIIIVAAKIGGHLAIKISQPEVLGELLIGVALGSLAIFGYDGLKFLTTNEIITILSEIGIIFLLFDVGLETSVNEMQRVGISSLFVALLGVVAPFFLGTACSYFFAPNADMLVHYFVGATLTATSVGITARVLKDLKKISSSEGKIILGAAVIDDVLGLLILAIVTSIVDAKSAGSELMMIDIVKLAGIAIGFLAAVIFLGRHLVSALMVLASKLKSKDLLLITSIAICFLLSYLASLSGLAPIIGAFAAGLILEPVHYKGKGLSKSEREVRELIEPITGLLVPVFFVTMGARVDLTVFGDSSILIFATVLSIVAILGKQVCSFGVVSKGVDKLVVGLGMIPRGEVGLIFAGIGVTLQLNGKPLIDPAVFGAVVIMVIVTTVATPPLIKWRMAKGKITS